MAYGHAERNLAFVLQLEAETRKLLKVCAGTRLPEPADATAHRENAGVDQPEVDGSVTN